MEILKEELKQLEAKGQLRGIPSIETKFDNKICINGREYINFASNDYLGISTNISLKEEFFKQDKSLMSSASARLLSGTSKEYSDLEKIRIEKAEKRGSFKRKLLLIETD